MRRKKVCHVRNIPVDPDHGASSGMGIALAEHFAGPGQRLVLVARNQERLDKTASLCRALGAQTLFMRLICAIAEAFQAIFMERMPASPLILCWPMRA